jgi:chloramphenicol-sensitive protein RarD
VAAGESRSGLLFGLAAYGLWGIFPLYWTLMEPASAFEQLGHRIVWSAVFMVALVTLLSRRAQLRQVVASPRTLRLLVIAAVTISINWGVFIWGVNNGHVVETSLGYFINPLVTVLAGVLVLGERLRRLQWAAVALAGLAVAGLTVSYGRPPWVALTLAFSFATYGLVRKQANVGAVEGLTVETLIAGPIALGWLIWLQASGGSTALVDLPWHLLLLTTTGVITSLPLLCFGAAATRIPLTTLGLLQYVAPTCHLLLGVWVFHEPMPLDRLLGFVVIWAGLALFTVDALRHSRQRRLDRVELEAAAA